MEGVELSIIAAVLMEEGWKIHALTSSFLSASGKGKYRRQCRLTVVIGEKDITVSFTKGKETGTTRFPNGDGLEVRLADLALT